MTARLRQFPAQYQDGLIPSNPFATVDRDGWRIDAHRGEERAQTRPKSSWASAASMVAIQSVEFCHEIGLTYVICSRPRPGCRWRGRLP